MAARPTAKASTPKAAPKGRSPAWYLSVGLLLLMVGLLTLVFARAASSPLAGVGATIMGITFVVKGFQGFARLSTPAAPSRVGEDPALSIWQAPWFSFYSRRFYSDVGRRGPGLGLGYLLTLEAVTWLVSILLAYSGLLVLWNSGQRFITQVPPIGIHDGKARVDAPQPYYIRIGEGKDVFSMALDTTGEIANLESRPDLAALLTRDKLFNRRASGTIDAHDLSKYGSFEVSQPILRSWVERYTVPVCVVLYLLVVLVGFGYRLAQALLYAGIGLGFASLFKKPLAYGASLRLSVAAVTPVILVDMILDEAGVTQASGLLWWLVCLAAALGFLAFAVKSLDEE